MEINEKMMRELRRKFEMEAQKKEIEIVEHWRRELETIYRKKYENLSALQVDLKNLADRMTNRISILTRMVREAS